MTTPFENGKVTHQIAVSIGKRVLKRIAYTGLHRQMNDPIKVFSGKPFSYCIALS